MSSEARLKKLRGSGGYVMARVTDEQQSKGSLGGPDLFLAPVGRLPEESISRYFCNACEKESEGAPGIEFESPGEVVAENLVLAERGQYRCSCGSTIAEYREFRKQDESAGIGAARPEAGARPGTAAQDPPAAPREPPGTAAGAEEAPAQAAGGAIGSIEGRDVIDEDANRVGVAKRVGIDASQSMVLVIAGRDGTESSVPWSGIRKVGEVVLLGGPAPAPGPGGCPKCGRANKAGSKFCEECGSKLQ